MPLAVLPAALAAFWIMAGFGVLFPVLPYFSQQLGLSMWEYAWLLGVYPAVGVLAGPLWGRFSDRFGRRPAIALGLAGFGLSFVLFGLGQGFAELFGARVLGGALGAAALPAVFAYAADVSPPERRSAAMGVVGAALGLGLAFGPALGGALSGYGLRVPFFAAGGIAVLGGAGRLGAAAGEPHVSGPGESGRAPQPARKPRADGPADRARSVSLSAGRLPALDGPPGDRRDRGVPGRGPAGARARVGRRAAFRAGSAGVRAAGRRDPPAGRPAGRREGVRGGRGADGAPVCCR